VATHQNSSARYLPQEIALTSKQREMFHCLNTIAIAQSIDDVSINDIVGKDG
jgi:hypothetical protein